MFTNAAQMLGRGAHKGWFALRNPLIEAPLINTRCMQSNLSNLFIHSLAHGCTHAYMHAYAFLRGVGLC